MAEMYEYARQLIDIHDLSALNRLGGRGWRVVAVVRQAAGEAGDNHYALLERKLKP